MSTVTRWEYLTVPLLIHATKQILDNYGADGWELVQVVPGPHPENLVANLKRPLAEGRAHERGPARVARPRPARGARAVPARRRTARGRLRARRRDRPPRPHLRPAAVRRRCAAADRQGRRRGHPGAGRRAGRHLL